MVITQTIANTTIIINKLGYKLKKLTGYFYEDRTDREKMTAYFLPKVILTIYIAIEKKTDNTIEYKVDIDQSAKFSEEDINPRRIYNIVNNLCKEVETLDSKVIGILLDQDYDIVGYSTKISEYIPYKLTDKVANKKAIEICVGNSYAILDDIIKDKEHYCVWAFPDSLKLFDYYTIHSLIYLLVKIYVEDRFMVLDEKRLEERRIISKEGFLLTFYHLSSILNIPDTNKETIKYGFDTMSKMNLLPHVPDKVWWVEENMVGININRLVDVITKKEKAIDRIKNRLDKDDDKDVDNFFIPDYYKSIFEIGESGIMGWKDFTQLFLSYEVNIHGGFRYDMWDDDFDDVPLILVPESNISEIDVNDILFMGYYGSKLYISLQAHTRTDKETPEEVKLKRKFQDYLYTIFRLDSEITFENPKDDDKVILLEAGG